MLKVHYDIVDSTNDMAKKLLTSCQEVIVTADIQTNGKGRNGKVWHSGYTTDIIFSHALRITADLLPLHRNPLTYQACAALSVQAFLLTLFPNDVMIRIKYPNDIHIKYGHLQGKISGSLIETEYSGNLLQTIIVGIGINVQTKSTDGVMPPEGISVFDILKKQLPLPDLRDQFIEIYTKYISLSPELIHVQWKDSLHIKDKEIRIQGEELPYTVVDILDDGTLYVQEGNNSRIIYSGDSIRYDVYSA